MAGNVSLCPSAARTAMAALQSAGLARSGNHRRRLCSAYCTSSRLPTTFLTFTLHSLLALPPLRPNPSPSYLPLHPLPCFLPVHRSPSAPAPALVRDGASVRPLPLAGSGAQRARSRMQSCQTIWRQRRALGRRCGGGARRRAAAVVGGGWWARMALSPVDRGVNIGGSVPNFGR